MVPRVVLSLLALLLTLSGCAVEREGDGGFTGTGVEPSPSTDR